MTLHQLAAWGVHCLTGSGAVCGLMAIVTVQSQDWRSAYAWLLLGLAIDGIDGTLARRLRVQEVIPNYDGHMIDYVVDHLNFVIVPVLIVYWSELVPENLRLAACGLILSVSMYRFGLPTTKTEDCYFQGFPCVWHIVTYYLFLLRLPPIVAFGVLLLFCGLCLVPVKFAHPFRIAKWPLLTQFMACLGLGSNAVILRRREFPSELDAASVISLASVAYLCGVGLLRTFNKGTSPQNSAGLMPHDPALGER